MDLCKKKGVSCYSMCKELNISQNTISTWKNRPNTGVSLNIAIKLSKYFEVPIETFQKKEV